MNPSKSKTTKPKKKVKHRIFEPRLKNCGRWSGSEVGLPALHIPCDYVGQPPTAIRQSGGGK